MSMRDELKATYRPRPSAAAKPSRPAEVSQPWTATRCHRLLRPLISRIASLRKEVAISSSSKPLDTNHVSDRTSAKRRSSECDWLLPTTKRAKLHRTYSQKRYPASWPRQSCADGKSPNSRSAECSRQGGTTKLHGEIIPSTPLLRRARGHAVSSPPQNSDIHREPNQDSQSNSESSDPRRRRKPTLPQKQLDDRLAALKTQIPPNRHSDYEAIYRSLETLLTATNPALGERKGPRSFLDMCLRKVPDYITELEAWEKSEAERNGTLSTLDNADTSMQIYSELESLGPVQGWRHLRVVVRADGLRAVKEAVSEGLFDDAFLELLIDLCMVMGAPSEAEELIESMVQREYPCPQTTDASFAELPSMQPLSALLSFANRTNRASYLLRQHTQLLSSSSLPQDWLGTQEFENIWGRAILGISKEETASEATRFIITAISLLSTRKRSPGGRNEETQLDKELGLANQQALVSALATVAAMRSLGENEMRSSRLSDTEEAKVSRIGKRLQYILQSSLAEVGTPSRGQTSFGARLLHLALFLSSLECQGDKAKGIAKGHIEAINRVHTEYSYTTTKEDRLRKQYNTMISLISSTARSCARGLSLPSHDCLDSLFQQLATLGLEDSILDRMKAAAAFTLAQQTHNVRDLIYAEKLTLEEGLRREPQTQSLFAGYRWDATIGEWVTVSPVKRRVPQPVTRRLLRSSSAASLKDSSQDADSRLFPPPTKTVRCPDSSSRRSSRSAREDSHRVTETLDAAAVAVGRTAEGSSSSDHSGTRRHCVRILRRHSSCPQELRTATATATTTATSARENTTTATTPPRRPALRHASSNLKLGADPYDDDELSQEGKENRDLRPGRKRPRSGSGAGRLAPLAAQQQHRPGLSARSRIGMLYHAADDSSDDELGM